MVPIANGCIDSTRTLPPIVASNHSSAKSNRMGSVFHGQICYFMESDTVSVFRTLSVSQRHQKARHGLANQPDPVCLGVLVYIMEGTQPRGSWAGTTSVHAGTRRNARPGGS